MAWYSDIGYALWMRANREYVSTHTVEIVTPSGNTCHNIWKGIRQSTIAGYPQSADTLLSLLILLVV